MKTYCAILLYSTIFFCCNCKRDNKKIEICQNPPSQQIKKVSLENVEKIRQLEGLFVEIEGIFRYRFEDVGIYPSKTSTQKEALWINTAISDSIPNESLQALDQKKVLVIGKVNLLDKGHFNSYIGALDSVYCIKER